MCGWLGRDRARLAREAVAGGLVDRVAGLDDLDGHVALEPRVAAAIDLAHAARADRAEDVVRSERRAGGQCHQASES
jgi:hypothetical protein